MDGQRFGRIVRAVRQHAGLRQADVATSSGISQRWVSEIELGRIDGVSLPILEAVTRTLGIDLRLEARWRSGEIDRLLDRDHAAIVEAVVARLRRHGWEIRLEYGFNHYGDRGSVDVLGWRAETRTLLIVEVKSRLTDLQAILASLARKIRIVPKLIGRDGWEPARTAHLLVVLGSTANRRVVDRHASIFDVSFPDRGPMLAGWLAAPHGSLRRLWMIAPRTVASGNGPNIRRHRVRTQQQRSRRA